MTITIQHRVLRRSLIAQTAADPQAVVSPADLGTLRISRALATALSSSMQVRSEFTALVSQLGGAGTDDGNPFTALESDLVGRLSTGLLSGKATSLEGASELIDLLGEMDATPPGLRQNQKGIAFEIIDRIASGEYSTADVMKWIDTFRALTFDADGFTERDAQAMWALLGATPKKMPPAPQPPTSPAPPGPAAPPAGPAGSSPSSSPPAAPAAPAAPASPADPALPLPAPAPAPGEPGATAPIDAPANGADTHVGTSVSAGVERDTAKSTTPKTISQMLAGKQSVTVPLVPPGATGASFSVTISRTSSGFSYQMNEVEGGRSWIESGCWKIENRSSKAGGFQFWDTPGARFRSRTACCHAATGCFRTNGGRGRARKACGRTKWGCCHP